MEFLSLQCLNFSPTSRETPEPPGDKNSEFLSFLVFCGHKLLRACLKAPALTGYVGDAQLITPVDCFLFLDASPLLTVGVFLLTVRLFTYGGGTASKKDQKPISGRGGTVSRKDQTRFPDGRNRK